MVAVDIAEPAPMGIGSFATAWSVETSRMAWFLGAGASAAAGVPTASMVRDDLFCKMYAHDHAMTVDDLDQTDPDTLARVRGHFNDVRGFPPLGSATDYSTAFVAAMPEEETRRKYLQSQFAGGTPSYGQRVLGALVATGGADVLITTNFDDLIETATMDARTGCNVLGAQRYLKVHGLRGTGSAGTVLSDGSWPLLLKLHGDFREGRQLKNTEPELQQQDAEMLQLVADLSRTHGLVVAGYSGRDASVMTMLIDSCRIPNAWPAGLWWLVRDVSTVPSDVKDLLRVAMENGVTARLVEAGPFDEMMGHLADQASLAPTVREYLRTLRPKGRVLSSSPSFAAASSWPILRFNALPLRAVKISAVSVPLAQLSTQREVGEKLRAAGWFGSWSINAGGVLAVGDAGRLAKAVGAGVGTAKIAEIALSPSLPGPHQSVVLQALASAWARDLPFTVRTQRGGVYLLATVPRDNEREGSLRARATLANCYGGPLTGKHPRSTGVNMKNEGRSWAERLTLRMVYEADQWWVGFYPTTWTQKPQDADAVDPAVAWNRERWAKRRKNEFWAELIDTWSTLLCPTKESTVSVLPLNLDGEMHDNYVQLDRRTAYSWSAS